MLKFELPFPPSCNHYWGQFRNRRFIKKRGVEFRDAVATILADKPKLVGIMAIEIAVMVPDNRKRDIDNLLKATLDAIQHAGLFKDDNLIHDIRIYKKGKCDSGKLEVKIWELE